MWRLMTMVPTIFLLRLVVCSLLTLSILATFGSEIKRRTRKMLKAFKWNESGEGKPITSLKNSGNSCEPSATSSKRNWGWISGWIGRWHGTARIVPALVVVICCLCLVTVPASIALAKYFSRYPVYELQDVHVDQQLTEAQTGRPGFHYWMAYYSESVGKIRFLATFCSDYKPQFEAGSTLKLLRYEDRGACWGLTNDHTGYLITRDTNGRAIKTF